MYIVRRRQSILQKMDEAGAFDKSSLFDAIEAGGVLPRKTFSIGEDIQKRYYMECRKLTK